LLNATPPVALPFPITPLTALLPLLEPARFSVIVELVVPPVIPSPKVRSSVVDDALLENVYVPELVEVVGSSTSGAFTVSVMPEPVIPLAIWIVPPEESSRELPPVLPIVKALGVADRNACPKH